MPGAPLSLPEREEVSVALIEDRSTSWAEMGRRVGRHPTTVARDVEAHGGRDRYRPALAQRSAEKARGRPRPRVLEVPGPLRDRVTAELRLGCSPWAIWADLVADGVEDRVCVETILRRGLEFTAEAIDAGIDVCGFFHWTGVDNYEWLHGFDVKFGIIDVDRNIRPSAHVLADAARLPA